MKWSEWYSIRIPEPVERGWGCGPLCGRKVCGLKAMSAGSPDTKSCVLNVDATAGPGAGGGYAVRMALR